MKLYKFLTSCYKWLFILILAIILVYLTSCAPVYEPPVNEDLDYSKIRKFSIYTVEQEGNNTDLDSIAINTVASVAGFCDYEDYDFDEDRKTTRFKITCKVAPNGYKTHYLRYNSEDQDIFIQESDTITELDELDEITDYYHRVAVYY